MPPKKEKGKPKKAKGGAANQLLAATAKNAPVVKKKIPPPPACFKSADIEAFKEIFNTFDENKIEKVPISVIPYMLRKVGFNPKGAEIQFFFKKILEDEFVDTVEFHEWLQMIECKLTMPDEFEREITQAFAALGHDDKENGICQMDILKHELFTRGEPLEENEFIDFVKLAQKFKTYNVEDGNFVYPTFVENLNNKDSRFIKEPINYYKLDQKALAQMAIEKQEKEREEQARLEEEKKVREEAKRQRMIASGLILI